MRLRLALATLVAAGLAPVVGVPEAACAGEGARAALVVDTGPDTHRFCVALPDGSASGIELIELASEQHGLAYDLGFGGGAVCMLAGVGPTGDDCFAEYPDFWGYWRGDDDGGWSWGSSGAASTTVGDGDVEGWAWGSGDGPEAHPAPPATDFDDVCETQPAAPLAPGPRPDRKDRATPPGDGGAAPGDAGAAPRPAGDANEADGREPRKPEGRDRRAREATADPIRPEAPIRPLPRPSATDEALPPARLATEPALGRPSPAAVAAVVLALGLIAMGAVVGRRRRAGP